MNGIINIYKPKGVTSHDVVYKIRKMYGIKRVGHAGTLDPMATGVLPVLVGNACAAQEYIMEHDKTYIAGLRLGTVTDTGDITGEILKTCDNIPDTEAVKSTGESFVGSMKQLPPMYSAIKIGGKKLYELAREGKTVEREARDITVYSSKMLEKVNNTDYYFEFSVSKGTYIRTLGEDIGAKLGCGGTLFSLERTVCGEFSKSDAHTLEELTEIFEKEGRDGLKKLLYPAEMSFYHLSILKLPEFYTRLCKNGLEIYLARIGNPKLNVGDKIRIYDNNGVFFAIGEVGEYKEGIAVKAKVRFDTVRK